uniref:C2H2-type domain-containing protein n=1 Tax=Angiostrongylus cantonensis TaxID=6313 RepID=A0A0K0D828_ANGCA
LPYKCSYCSSSFFSLTLKKQHEKTHYQRNGKNNSGLATIVIEDIVENDSICNDDAEATNVDTHIYACPVVECGMQSQIKEEVTFHLS